MIIMMLFLKLIVRQRLYLIQLIIEKGQYIVSMGVNMLSKYNIKLVEHRDDNKQNVKLVQISCKDYLYRITIIPLQQYFKVVKEPIIIRKNNHHLNQPNSSFKQLQIFLTKQTKIKSQNFIQQYTLLITRYSYNNNRPSKMHQPPNSIPLNHILKQLIIKLIIPSSQQSYNYKANNNIRINHIIQEVYNNRNDAEYIIKFSNNSNVQYKINGNYIYELYRFIGQQWVTQQIFQYFNNQKKKYRKLIEFGCEFNIQSKAKMVVQINSKNSTKFIIKKKQNNQIDITQLDKQKRNKPNQTVNKIVKLCCNKQHQIMKERINAFVIQMIIQSIKNKNSTSQAHYVEENRMIDEYFKILMAKDKKALQYLSKFKTVGDFLMLKSNTNLAIYITKKLIEEMLKAKQRSLKISLKKIKIMQIHRQLTQENEAQRPIQPIYISNLLNRWLRSINNIQFYIKFQKIFNKIINLEICNRSRKHLQTDKLSYNFDYQDMLYILNIKIQTAVSLGIDFNYQIMVNNYLQQIIATIQELKIKFGLMKYFNGIILADHSPNVDVEQSTIKQYLYRLQTQSNKITKWDGIIDDLHHDRYKIQKNLKVFYEEISQKVIQLQGITIDDFQLFY